jgi:amino acid permease
MSASPINFVELQDKEDKEDKDDKEDKEGKDCINIQRPNSLKGTVTGTVINMLHNILGVGVLSIAITLSYGTLAIALLLNLFMCIVAIISTNLIVDMMVSEKVTNWNELIHKAFKRPCIAKTTVGTISLTTFFSSVAFAIITIDGLVNSGYISNRYWSAVLVFVCTLPFVLLKNMEALKFSSAFGISGIAFASGVVVYFAIMNSVPSSEKGDIIIIGYKFTVFICFAIFALSYAMQYNVPRFYQEIRDGTNNDAEAVTKMKKATIIANLISFVWYTVTGIAGYLCFGDKSTGDILNAFLSEGNIIQIVRIILSASLITSIPLTLHCCREEFISLVYGKYIINNIAYIDDTQNLNANNNTTDAISSNKRKLISTVILALICLIAATISKIEILLSFKGATLISFIVFFLPTICAYKLKPPNWKCSAIILTITGSICTVFGLIAAIKKVQ